ncbi:hypothetical protein WH8501_17990 [Crocosphaera watsonii WH 8501]|uniref:hypothetical protein n=1 Tax=Crocosphaera watsonii TaxID=263511 RepID=UPI0002F36643|nr:hypothetical protein [Crocosphaera watsonii]
MTIIFCGFTRGFKPFLSKPIILNPNFSQNLRSPNTEALQEVGLNRAIADFPNQQSVVRF